MRWTKYSEFAAQHPELGPCLKAHIGPATLRARPSSHPDFTFQSWVEKQVRFVAVRPFTSLNLGAKDSDTNTKSVRYVIWFHIGNEEGSCARARYLRWDGAETTVQQMFDNLVAWHLTYWAKQPNRPLVLDAVVRHTTIWCEDEKYDRESVEFFLIPDGFVP